MKKVIAILALGASLAFGQSASIKLPGYKAGQRLIDQGKLLSQADKEKIEKAVAGAPVPTVVVVMADFPSIDNDGLYPADQFAKKYHLGKFSKQNSVVLLVSPRRGDVARRWSLSSYKENSKRGEEEVKKANVDGFATFTGYISRNTPGRGGANSTVLAGAAVEALTKNIWPSLQ